MRKAWRLSLWMLLGLTPLLGSCIVDEEEAFSATFTVWCAVADSSGLPVDGQMVAFQAYKLDYDGYEDPGSSFTNTKATYSDVGHPGAASFVVGYTLHKKGDSQEQAYFACSVPVVTPSGPTWLTEETSMDYGAMVSAGQAIDVELTVTLTPRAGTCDASPSAMSALERKSFAILALSCLAACGGSSGNGASFEERALQSRCIRDVLSLERVIPDGEECYNLGYSGCGGDPTPFASECIHYCGFDVCQEAQCTLDQDCAGLGPQFECQTYVIGGDDYGRWCKESDCPRGSLGCPCAPNRTCFPPDSLWTVRCNAHDVCEGTDGCPTGCRTPSGLSCCGGAFCGGDCVGTPCCD